MSCTRCKLYATLKCLECELPFCSDKCINGKYQHICMKRAGDFRNDDDDDDLVMDIKRVDNVIDRYIRLNEENVAAKREFERAQQQLQRTTEELRPMLKAVNEYNDKYFTELLKKTLLEKTTKAKYTKLIGYIDSISFEYKGSGWTPAGSREGYKHVIKIHSDDFRLHLWKTRDGIDLIYNGNTFHFTSDAPKVSTFKGKLKTISKKVNGLSAFMWWLLAEVKIDNVSVPQYIKTTTEAYKIDPTFFNK